MDHKKVELLVPIPPVSPHPQSWGRGWGGGIFGFLDSIIPHLLVGLLGENLIKKTKQQLSPLSGSVSQTVRES
jgi:hypothetical protein